MASTQKIISISLKNVPQGMPQHFIVDQPPIFKYNANGTTGGNLVPDCPAVNKITFPAIDNPKRVYPDPCYIVSFVDSEIKRIIPVAEVIDVCYTTVNTKPAKGDSVPDLPED
ncbi:MAG TPA: hypothetical protein VI911_00540 [Patescibacteria group bacterium]|nr:hypothetical protein [Patescibacteria group bacterium]